MTMQEAQPRLDLNAESVRQLAQAALAEDAPWGDLTSELFVQPGLEAQLAVRLKSPGVICGLPVAQAVFLCADPATEWTAQAADGDLLEPGTVVAHVKGKARGLLLGERVALNFLQRLSGIATLTHAYAKAAREGSPHAKLVDTRKTTPGLRLLEKYAVRMGGGTNHRFGLSDGILVKDNHLEAVHKAGITLVQAIAHAKAHAPHLGRLEVEVETMDAAREALEAGADVLLLDNMSLEHMREAVDLCKEYSGARGEAQGKSQGKDTGRVLTEASGNITLERIAQVAATGVDFISAGALTHSAPALDISLDFIA